MGTVPIGTRAAPMMASRVASRSPPVERSITVSAPQRSAQSSFSTSSAVPLETGEAPMLALILVRLARPMAIGSRAPAACTRLAGITMRPAATSSRTCSAVRWGSRSATRRISGVIAPSRACSSWVTGSKPAGACQRPSASRRQSGGMKSQAVLCEGGGMPGASGELKARLPPSWGGLAKLPGVVPCAPLDGSAPPGGSV